MSNFLNLKRPDSRGGILRPFVMVIFMSMALGFMASPPTMAQSEDPKAQEIKSIVNDFLSRWKSQSMIGSANWKMDGDLTVKKQNNYYSVTTPSLSISFQNEGEVDIGIIAMNISQHTDPDFWKTTVAFPRPIVIFDKEGNKTSQINIGSQRFAGLWHRPSAQFTKLDSTFKDLTLESAKNPQLLTIGAFDIQMDLNKNRNNLYDGPILYSFKDVSLKDNKTIDLSFKEAKIDGSLSGYNLNAQKDFEKRMEKELESFLEALKKEDPPVQKLSEFYITAFNMAGELFQGFESNVELHDLNVRHTPEDGEPQKFQIERIMYGVDMSGFGGQTTNFGFRFGYNGVETGQVPEQYQKYVPTNFKIDYRLENLPLKELLKVGTQMAGQAEPENRQTMAIQAAMMTPQILSKSGTIIKIQENNIGNEFYNVIFNGNFKADAQAAYQAVGSAFVKFKGLDELLKSLQADAQNAASPKQKQRFMQAVQGLSMVQLLGQKDQENPGTRYYDLELTKTGEFRINGSSLQNIMGGQTRGQTEGQK